MSVQQLAAVFERSKSRNGARLVLLSIANHDGDGGSWPTIATICREAGLTERSVHEALRRLQDDGELKVHPNAGGTMGWRHDRRPNRYEIVLPNGVEDSATPSTNGVEDSSERGGRIPRHGVEDSATQTIQEPPREPSTRAVVDQAFNAFWSVYPRKTAKRTALAAYERALKRATAIDALNDRGHAIWKIQHAAEQIAKQWKNASVEDLRYCKHPTTWLNGDCWEDEMPMNGKRPRTVDEDVQATIASYNSERYN